MLQSDWFHIFSYAPGSQKVPARVRNFNIRANLFWERQMENTRVTKKDRIIKLYDRGLDVESIAEALATSPSYVANTLIRSGRSVEYEDLYTSTSGRAYSPEARRLAGILKFKDVAAAKESVRRLQDAFLEFGREGNKSGRHRAQMLALIGKNRAEGLGKTEEASIFRDWLIHTLTQESAEERERTA